MDNTCHAISGGMWNVTCNMPRPDPIVNANTNVLMLVSYLTSFLYAPSIV
jgi:hypothetical protein